MAMALSPCQQSSSSYSLPRGWLAALACALSLLVGSTAPAFAQSNASNPPTPIVASSDSATAKPHSAIPFKHEASAGGANLGGGALGLLLISLAAIGTVWWARKKLNLQPQGAAAGQSLRIVESQRLGPKAVLSVIEFDGQRYLIAQSEQGITCLVPPANSTKLAQPQEASHAQPS